MALYNKTIFFSIKIKFSKIVIMRKYFLFVCVIFIILFSSCSQKKKNTLNEDSINITLESSNSEFSSSPQTWHITNKRICVIFGYNFNSEEIYTPLLENLSKKYGLDENGGLILPLIYPESFKHGVKGYSSDLFSILNDDEIEFSGVIILGAPEKTHQALARLQDKWNEKIPYPIIALFPQDDILGLEFACDIVIDQEGNFSDLEEEHSQNIPQIDKILEETVDYVVALKSSLPRDISIQTHVQQMYKNRNVRRYLDPESGLQSINHFVLN